MTESQKLISWRGYDGNKTMNEIRPSTHGSLLFNSYEKSQFSGKPVDHM